MLLYRPSCNLRAIKLLIPSCKKESDAAPNHSDRQTARLRAWGKRAAGGSLTTVGLRPPSVSPPPGAILILIVARFSP
jgi:hypothetical protein